MPGAFMRKAGMKELPFSSFHFLLLSRSVSGQCEIATYSGRGDGDYF